MAIVRLQGLEWHVRKHKLKITEIFNTGNGIRLNCIDPITRQQYSHYLNETELKLYSRLMEELEEVLFEKKDIAFTEEEEWD